MNELADADGSSVAITADADGTHGLVSQQRSGGVTENCGNSTGGTAAPCRPNASGHLKTSLKSATVGSGGTISRNFWNPNPQLFSWPGLDQIGNAGANTYRGPTFFNDDMAISKAFTFHENIAAKFRMDAFNAFNHIDAGNPSNTDVASGTNNAPITGGAPGYAPRQLEFSLHIQF